jgi:hypothetical protein
LWHNLIINSNEWEALVKAVNNGQISFIGCYPEPYLLAVSKTRRTVVDFTSNYSTVMIDHSIKNLIINPVDQNIYFKSGRKVYRANFDASDKEIVYQDEENHIRLFALDWIAQRMFWVDSKENNSIFEGNVNFSNGTQIHVSDNIIASLAVDSNVG